MMNDNDSQNIQAVYQQYIATVIPLIATYETLANEFPVAILNEIRAMFTHIARANTQDNCEPEILGAMRHLVRTQRDCFKYLCTAYEDHYREFRRTYRNTNLNHVDNGEFLPLLARTYSTARDQLIAAKLEEATNEDDNAILTAYETASNTFKDVYDMTSGANIHKFVRLKWQSIVYRIFCILGWVFGAVGTFCSVYGLLHK